MDNLIIVVEKEHFSGIQVCPSDKFIQKAQWLRQTFQCFQESDGCGKWHKPHHTAAVPKVSQHRTRIGTCELSIENFTKKDIVSLMNKLAPTNKEHIIKKLKSTFRPEFAKMYVEIIWDLMLRSPDYQDIYADVLLGLSCDDGMLQHVRNVYTDYVSTHPWVPASECIPSTEEYDDFCDYVKWKKRTLAAIKACVQLCRKMLLSQDHEVRFLQDITSSADKAFIENDHRMFDIHVEQILTFAKVATTTTVKIHPEWLASAPQLAPSTRFKIYDLQDILSKKNCKKR